MKHKKQHLLSVFSSFIIYNYLQITSTVQQNIAVKTVSLILQTIWSSKIEMPAPSLYKSFCGLEEGLDVGLTIGVVEICVQNYISILLKHDTV